MSLVDERKTMGRPRLPEYRGKLHRYGKIEDKFTKIIPLMKSSYDRKLVEKVLEELKN